MYKELLLIGVATSQLNVPGMYTTATKYNLDRILQAETPRVALVIDGEMRLVSVEDAVDIAACVQAEKDGSCGDIEDLFAELGV